jgi:hypothetical protein
MTGWRDTRAAALDADALVIEDTLVALAELEMCLALEEAVCFDARTLAGRLRTIRNDLTREAQRLRDGASTVELEEALREIRKS